MYTYMLHSHSTTPISCTMNKTDHGGVLCTLGVPYQPPANTMAPKS